METAATLLMLCLVASVLATDEITTEAASTVAATTTTLPTPPASLDSRARLLLDSDDGQQQDPNILILGSQQTPNFPTVRPTFNDPAELRAAGPNNDWTPIVWPSSTRVPVSLVAPSLSVTPSASSRSTLLVIRPTQLVADQQQRPLVSIVTAPARIASALPTRTVAPTGGASRIRVPAPVSVTRFDFGDVATSRPSGAITSESDSVISPSAPVPSELPISSSTESASINETITEQTFPSVTESTTKLTMTTPETLNVTTSTASSPTTEIQIMTSPSTSTSTEAPVTSLKALLIINNETVSVSSESPIPNIPSDEIVDTLPKSVSNNDETSALNDGEGFIIEEEEISTDGPMDDSSVPAIVDVNLLDTAPPLNDTAFIEEELEAQVTEQPTVINEETTDLIAELEDLSNNTFSVVELSSIAPEVNQTLYSSTTTETLESYSTSSPIVSLDVTSSTAPTNSLLDETTVDSNEEQVTGRSTSKTTLSGVLSTLFPALTRAPSVGPTAPSTTPADIPTTSTTPSTTTSTTAWTTLTYPSTFWTTRPPPPPTFTIQSMVPFFNTPQATTNQPPITTSTIHFDEGSSTFGFSGSSTIEPSSNNANTTIIAVSVSVALVICLALLLLALLVLRRRRVRAAQGTCQPARMDAFSLENVSETSNNTWQRGKMRNNSLRASKRSYLNQAFDDSAVFSVPLTSAQLVLYMEKPITSIEAEFRNVATSSVRIDELPPGVETRNRYANVLPVPETRVHIRVADNNNRPGDDILEQYINANYIRGPKEEPKYYIACQGPMEHTVEDFWQMVWENQCRLIVQLTDLTENGVARCAEYLPPSEVLDCHRLYGDYQVTLKSRELRDKYVTSSVQLKRMEDNLVRDITHLWYSSWPVTGVPDDGKTIVELLLEARKAQSREQQAPIVVHCSPGTGRTGAVLAIDVCMRQLDSTSRMIDIPRSVHRLRQDRAGCVQTGEQYAFIYKAVHFYASQLSNAALDSL